MNKLVVYLIALISGVIGVFAFSPFDYWGLAYVSLGGLLFVAKNAKKSTALLGHLFVVDGLFLLWCKLVKCQHSSIWWGIPWCKLSLGGLAFGLPCTLSNAFYLFSARFQVQSAVIFAAIWTLTEFLRGWVFTGFPWLQFGYTQIDSPFFGIAPIFGVTGMTFFTVWASAVIFNLIFALSKKQLNLVSVNALLLLVVGGLSAYAGKVNFVQPKEDKGLHCHTCTRQY